MTEPYKKYGVWWARIKKGHSEILLMASTKQQVINNAEEIRRKIKEGEK